MLGPEYVAYVERYRAKDKEHSNNDKENVSMNPNVPASLPVKQEAVADRPQLKIKLKLGSLTKDSDGNSKTHKSVAFVSFPRGFCLCYDFGR